MNAPLAVTAWSAVSPFGIGTDALAEGVLSGRIALRSSDHDPAPVGRVPDFDVRALLGRKNTRAMDRITGLSVVTIGRLLDQERSAGRSPDGDHTALVLGTTTGSVQSMMDFTADALRGAKPYLVDPARFPNGVMNRAAGQSAIWHGLRGPNATIAAGHAAGVSALRYAARLHRSGHARTVLCGAVEELTPQRAWLEDKAGRDTGRRVLGEGCAVVRIESERDAVGAGLPVLARLLTTVFRVHREPADSADALRRCASAVLAAAGARERDVWAVAGDLTAEQRAAVEHAVGTPVVRIDLADTAGDTGAATGALHLAAVLARAAADPDAADRLALVASVDREGLVGVAGLRVRPRREEDRS